jgi:hypothetical protein
MTAALPYVIPAQAGIQNDGTRWCKPGDANVVPNGPIFYAPAWIPACAGMTTGSGGRGHSLGSMIKTITSSHRQSGQIPILTQRTSDYAARGAVTGKNESRMRPGVT